MFGCLHLAIFFVLAFDEKVSRQSTEVLNVLKIFPFSNFQMPSIHEKPQDYSLQGRRLNLAPLGDLLGIPRPTFTVVYFAAAVIAIYFAFIFGSAAAIGLVSYFGISLAQEMVESQLLEILSATAGGAGTRDGAGNITWGSN